MIIAKGWGGGGAGLFEKKADAKMNNARPVMKLREMKRRCDVQGCIDQKASMFVLHREEEVYPGLVRKTRYRIHVQTGDSPRCLGPHLW